MSREPHFGLDPLDTPSTPATNLSASTSTDASFACTTDHRANDPELQATTATVNELSHHVQAVLGRLELQNHGARTIVRRLGTDLAVTYRVLMGCRTSGRTSERLKQFPGAIGLRTFCEQLLGASGVSEHAIALRHAVDQYAALIDLAGGSHTKLVRRVQCLEAALGDGEPSPASESSSSRRTLIRSAIETMGYGVDLCSFIGFVRPCPDTPELIETCSAWGLIGLLPIRGRVCVSSQNLTPRSNAGDVSGEVLWTPLGSPIDGRDGLLTDFCSKPVPLAAADDGDGFIRQIVDPASLRKGVPATVVFARKSGGDCNPQYSGRTSIWSQIVRVRHPAHRLVMDVYVHTSMLASTHPSIGAYFWHPGLGNDPRKQWHDRMPGSPRIELLNSDAQVPSCKLWNRQTELTKALSAAAGWNSSEFVGFRCDERFPIWGAAYYMTFDLLSKYQK